MEWIALIGQILFGGFFLANGLNHLKNSGAMTGMAAAKGIPSAKLAVLGTGILLLAAGAGIILGVYPLIALTLVLVFLIPTTFTMHAFWRETDPTLRMGEQVNFMKNIALIGATLMLMTMSLPWLWTLTTL